MAPFLCSFSFLSFFLENFAPGSHRNHDSELARPTTSRVSLAWSGAQPCGARRAERLGRSGGPGQRRAPYRGCQLGGSLLHLAADRLMPRMVCRRRPLPFLQCGWHAPAQADCRRLHNLRLGGRPCFSAGTKRHFQEGCEPPARAFRGPGFTPARMGNLCRKGKTGV
jgi:hypothetical protein